MAWVNKSDFANISYFLEEKSASCAILSVYGEELGDFGNQPGYSLSHLENIFEPDSHEADFNLEKHLKRLERLGYLERHQEIYRLRESNKVQQDALEIYNFRKEIYGDHPENMILAFEQADLAELRQKDVKLVQEPAV